MNEPPALQRHLRARDFARNAARDVGEYLRTGYDRIPQVVSDGPDAGGVVTELDVEGEARLKRALVAFDPNIGFMCEEDDASDRADSDTFWTVDAVGGTGHLLRGTLFSSTMISLVEDGEVVVGVIHDFRDNRTYSAVKGDGAEVNGDRLAVSKRNLRQAYVAAEMRPEIDPIYNPRLLTWLHANFTTITMANYGWDFTSLASGQIEAVVTKDPWGGPWDIAPGVLIATEAGAKVTCVDATPYRFGCMDVVVGVEPVVDAIMLGLSGRDQ